MGLEWLFKRLHLFAAPKWYNVVYCIGVERIFIFKQKKIAQDKESFWYNIWTIKCDDDEQKKNPLQMISYLIKMICNPIKQIAAPILRWYWKSVIISFYVVKSKCFWHTSGIAIGIDNLHYSFNFVFLLFSYEILFKRILNRENFIDI